MGSIRDFFFSGAPADIGTAVVVLIAAWITWAGGYNRE